MTDEEDAKLVELHTTGTAWEINAMQKGRMAMYIVRLVTATPAAVSAY